MGLQDTLNVLSEFIEVYESREMAVQEVETRTAMGESGTELHATLDLLIPLCGASSTDLHSALSPVSATSTDDGDLQIEYSLSPAELVPDCSAVVSTDTECAQVSDDGAVLLTLEVVIDAAAAEADSEYELMASEGDDDQGLTLTTNSDGESSASSADDVGSSTEDENNAETGIEAELQAVRNDDVPPYDDVPYLQKLYDLCDTFVEMSEWIEMDIAAETVRRYMIDADIHTPTSYNTAEDGHDGEDEKQSMSAKSDAAVTTPSPSVADDPIEVLPNKELIADGLGLPSDLQMEDIADAVVTSRTVYEVQRQLDLEQQYTRQLLRDLDLLDLVMGRVNDTSRDDVTREDVAERIRQCTPAEAGGTQVRSA